MSLAFRRDTKDKQFTFIKKFTAMTSLGRDVLVMLREAIDVRFFLPRYGKEAWGFNATVTDASYMMDAALYLLPGGRSMWHIQKLVKAFGGTPGMGAWLVS